MKRHILILTVILLCNFLGSCISLKIKPVTPPENQIEYIHLCKKVDDSGELSEPIDIQSEYTSKDEKIICLIKIQYVSKEIHLRWKWYSPDKKEVRDTGNVAVNRKAKYLEIITAYDEFKLNSIDKDSIKGQWTVVVFINDKLVGRGLFLVK